MLHSRRYRYRCLYSPALGMLKFLAILIVQMLASVTLNDVRLKLPASCRYCYQALFDFLKDPRDRCISHIQRISPRGLI